MKSKLLLTHYFKWIGLLLLIPCVILGAFFMHADFTFEMLQVEAGRQAKFISANNNNLTDELALTGIIISLLMMAFAKEKKEDEFIHFIRLESWQWAVLVNFVLLLLATWLLYDFDFLNVMVYNMLTVLVIFIIRFQFVVWRNKKGEHKSYAL